MDCHGIEDRSVDADGESTGLGKRLSACRNSPKCVLEARPGFDVNS